VPFAIWIALAALCGTAYAWPTLMGRITEGFNPAAKRQEAAQASGQPAKPSTPSLIIPDAPALVPGQAQGQAPSFAPAPPVLMGCAAAADACRCYDQAGQVVELELQICQAKLASPMPAKSAQDLAQILPGVPDALQLTSGAADGEVIGQMRAQAR
jgi:zona occludens toxin